MQDGPRQGKIPPSLTGSEPTATVRNALSEGGRVNAEAGDGKPARRPVQYILETDEARALLAAGQEHGTLTSDEIALAFDELDLDAGQLDEFYVALEEHQIEVVGEEADEPEEVAPAREVSTDALQLFLKDIGKVDLLTAAQEVELAKLIERGDHRAKQEMVEANLRLV